MDTTLSRATPPCVTILSAALFSAAAIAGAEGEIGFEETFALAPDRAAVLDRLVPGSEDHYFYSCLLFQQQGKLAEARALLDPWRKAHGETPRFRELRFRQILLETGAAPDAPADALARELGLQFQDERRQEAPPSAFPSKLDPAWISAEAFARVLPGGDNLSGYTDDALEALAATPLSDRRRHELLSRLSRRPDVAGFSDIVLADLDVHGSASFGSLPVHSLLTLSDLRALAGKRPDLLASDAFVRAMAVRLLPPDQAARETDPAALRDAIRPLLEFARSLPAAQNSFKANVLFRALECDLALDVHDRALFDEYLRLPRPSAFVRPEWRNSLRARGEWRPADFHAEVPGLFGPVGDREEALVRRYLAFFLADAPDASAFAETIEAGYLGRILAETKLLAGDPDSDRWYALLPAGSHAALRDRVEIDFLPHNPAVFGAGDTVSFAVAVKNVSRLSVQVFELNPFALYAAGDDLSTAIDLDGLAPTHERILRYDLPPLRRHVETIDVPEIRGRGVYVVELIGDTGVSSRALVRKGRLSAETRRTSAGTVFTVRDETGATVPDARVWIGGSEYAPDGDGTVLVPYCAPGSCLVSSAPSADFAILRQGDFAEKVRFARPAEEYALDMGFLLDRESLVVGTRATLLLHPGLACAGSPADVALLEDAALDIVATDAEGVATTARRAPLALSNTDATPVEFSVPEGTRALTFHFTAKVRNLSLGADQALEASHSIRVNGQDGMPWPSAAYLRRTDAGYRVEARGKCGEARPGRIVRLQFSRRGFVRPVEVTMQTDDAGAIDLGDLGGIVSLRLLQPSEWARAWELSDGAARLPSRLVVREGETVELPLAALPEADAPATEAASLLRMTGPGGPSAASFPPVAPVPLADASPALRLRGAAIAVEGLEAGSYRLFPKAPYGSGEVAIDVLPDGDARLPAAGRGGDPLPPRIVSLGAADGRLRAKIAHASADTRVTLLARWSCSDGLPVAWGAPESVEPPSDRPVARTLYVSGRTLGDEVRYVLDRRFSPPRIGNFLARPSLLLAPWEVRATRNVRQEARDGDEYAALSADAVPMAEMAAYGGDGDAFARRSAAGGPQAEPVYDFLPAPALVAADLVPDGDGDVSIPLDALGFRSDIVAIVSDGASWSARECGVSAAALAPRDRALRDPVPGTTHVERKRVTPLAVRESLAVPDTRSSQVVTVETVGAAFRLFRSLAPDVAPAEFAFLADWPALAPERREELYSRHACHELNLFLYEKDRPFFDRVVRPALETKHDKRFIDEWLLGRDLSRWLGAGSYQKLNGLERALLARRIPAARDGIVRQLSDDAEVRALRGADFDRRFQAAIRGEAFDDSGKEADKAGESDGKPFAEENAAPLGAALATGGAGIKMNRAIMARPAAAAAPAPQGSPVPARKQAGRDSARQLAADRLRREAAAAVYRPPELTKEWAESHYYRVPLSADVPSLVPCNAFWRDFALAADGVPFLSPALLEACSSPTEILCAIAVLGLPFESEGAMRAGGGGGETIVANSPMFVFHSQLEEAEDARAGGSLLVGEDFFDLEDRFAEDARGVRREKFVDGEFVAGRPYGARVSLANLSSTTCACDVLAQIPAGAVPLQDGFATRSRAMQLAPYAVGTFEYAFYFPEPGEFAHAPARASDEDGFLGAAAPRVLRVAAGATGFDRDSWPAVSQNGTDDEVLAFLAARNLARLDLSEIAFRMKDPGMFARTLALLRGRHAFHPALWRYAFLHRDRDAMREYLLSVLPADSCGPWFDSPLFSSDASADGRCEHLEYWPLVNARAHALGGGRRILNDAFAARYGAFLRYLCYKPGPGPRDRLALAVYLAMQDRDAEAAAAVENLAPGDIDETMQLDYLRVYFAFAAGDIAKARAIAGPWRDSPLPRWRTLFRDALAQADEAEGRPGATASASSPDAAAAAPVLELSEADGTLSLRYANLRSCVLRLYPMDLELVFSRNPFARDIGRRFAFVRPAFSETLALDASADRRAVPLPREFRSRNLLVEVEGGGASATWIHAPNGLDVRIVAPFGQASVLDTSGKPMPGVYVKAYARFLDGSVRFYKDGYTDLRGRFDYASLSTGDLARVERFALLFASDKAGFAIREAAPPAR